MLLDMNNYGEIYHKHKNCQDIRTDGTCRLIRHEPDCSKKMLQTAPRNKTKPSRRNQQSFETEYIVKN